MSTSENKAQIDTIKAVLSLAAGVTAVAYIAGFIIVNSFLVTNGITHFSILDSQFLTSGLCYLNFLGLLVVFFFAIPLKNTPSQSWDEMKKQREDNINSKLEKLKDKSAEFKKGYEKGYRFVYGISYYIGFTIAILIAHLRYLVMFVILLIPIFLISGSEIKILLNWQTLTWVIISVTTVMLLIDASRQNGPPWMMPTFIAGLLIIISLVVFGKYVYPFVSPTIGGGKPVLIRLIIDNDNKDLLSSSLGINTNNYLSDSVELLARTSDSLFLRAEVKGEKRVVKIKKDAISGIRYDQY